MAVQPLSWWRADPSRWSGLNFAPHADERGSDDVNRDKRAEVLDLLAADAADTDAAFIRHILRQEIAMHAASWGYGDSLGLAALLLAERRSVQDVWLLWEAKTATFDTQSGLNPAVLFGAGIVATLAQVEASDQSGREALLEYLTWHASNEFEDDDAVGQHLAGLRSYLTSGRG